MSNQTLLFQVVAVGAIAGAAAIMTFRKPNMRSGAYIRRSLLALLWAWGILAVAVCQIWRAGTGGWPDAEVFHPFAPGAALIGFLLVGALHLGARPRPADGQIEEAEPHLGGVDETLKVSVGRRMKQQLGPHGLQIRSHGTLRDSFLIQWEVVKWAHRQ